VVTPLHWRSTDASNGLDHAKTENTQRREKAISPLRQRQSQASSGRYEPSGTWPQQEAAPQPARNDNRGDVYGDVDPEGIER